MPPSPMRDLKPGESDDASTSKVIVEITAGPHRAERWESRSHETLVVGRAADAQWQLMKDPHFSRYHFRIEANPPDCHVIDLESSNGTFVNGQRVQSTALRNGDRIVCGETVFQISISQPPGTPAATLDLAPTERNATDGVFGDAVLPREFGEFQLQRVLGRGAMGAVYYALHKSGQPAAVKLVLPNSAAKEESWSLFLREATILSQMRHPRIVEYVKLGMHQGQMYLAMEYLPVTDIRTLLDKQSRPRQIRVACGLIGYALEALEYAHQHEVVHRDVKPSNMLVYLRDKRVNLKLADFGLAKNYLNAGLSSMTQENAVRGTIAFMAPEQLINCRYAKPSCDIYSTGVSLYWLLSGQLPHDRGGKQASLAQLLSTDPRPLSEAAPDVPLELAEIVDRSLAREPSDRFASAEEMRQQLLPFVSA